MILKAVVLGILVFCGLAWMVLTLSDGTALQKWLLSNSKVAEELFPFGLLAVTGLILWWVFS